MVARQAAGPAGRPQDTWRRLAVTAGVLAVYRVGSLLPMPGLDPELVQGLTEQFGPSIAIERLSVLALGIMPLVSALILLELLTLLVPSAQRWREAPETRFWTYRRTAMLLAIGAAILQGTGIAQALEAIPSLVSEPGSGFRLSTILTLTAGTAFVIWLAHIISQWGIGSGLWVLLLLPLILRAPGEAAALYERVQTGSLPAEQAILVFAIILAILVALAGLILIRERAGITGSGGVVWPPLIAGVVMGWFIAVGWLLPSDAAKSAWMDALAPGQPLFFPVYGGLIGLIAYLYAWREGERATAFLTAAALLFAVLGPELARLVVTWPVSVDGSMLVILAAVALETLRLWRPAAATGADTPSAVGPQS